MSVLGLWCRQLPAVTPPESPGPSVRVRGGTAGALDSFQAPPAWRPTPRNAHLPEISPVGELVPGPPNCGVQASTGWVVSAT
jgi:hypothetical protein